MEHDCIVIGAGQAGLAVSRLLQERAIDHRVIERGRIGESWLSRRWDSFRINTPNRTNGLPGMPYPGDPDAFPTAPELVAFFADYATQWSLPIETGVTVSGVARTSDGGFIVAADPIGDLTATAVVLACGPMTVPRIPAVAARLDPRVMQVHAGAYRSPSDLPPGGVLVVGSAQSGVQIAEELLEHGREVHLAVGRAGRAPRRYRGRDIVSWLRDVGFFDQRIADLPDPAMARLPVPQVSGVGLRGHTISLQSLAAQGARLVGRVLDVEGSRLSLDTDVASAIRFGDAVSAQIKAMVDAHVAATGIAAPNPEPDPADLPCRDPDAFVGPDHLDLAGAGIASVVWCTGFGPDLSWVHLPIFDDRGDVVFVDGQPAIPGLFAAGFPWQFTRASTLLGGVVDDATRVADAVARYLG